MSPPGCKKSSVVWNYFNKGDNNNHAKCNLCKKIIKYFGGTTNLRQHLRRIHPTIKLVEETPQIPQEEDEHENIGDVNIEANSSSSSIISSRSNRSIISSSNSCDISAISVLSSRSSGVTIQKNISSELQKKHPSKQLKLYGAKSASQISESKIASIDSKLLKMITKDYQPVSLVENEGFLEYSHELQPLYKPPSRKRLTNDILPKHYMEAVSLLKSMLSKIKHCAITTDIWTSDSNRAYLTVTCHFISEAKMCARVLATEEMCGSHTAENIARCLTSILNDWNISDKIVTVVSDNGSNVKKAINECLKKHHHPCVAHTLNLSVNDALSSTENLGEILKKCRALVGHFKHSVLASEKLKSVQEQMGLPSLKVKQDVATRWNSCFTMIDRLLHIKDPLCVAVTNLRNAPVFLDAEEWKILGECIQVLKSANDLTTILSAENYPTISLIIPLIRGFQYTLRNVITETDVGERLKNNLMETVTRRLGGFEINKIAAKACFLDPRLKKVGFGSEDNANNAQK